MHRAPGIRKSRRSDHRSSDYGWSAPSSKATSDKHLEQARGLPSPAAAQMEALGREIQSLRRDLLEAAQVQYRLNGPRELRRGSYEIACETFPVRPISGDFCTVFDVGRRTVFALGDIEGKGLTAGMWFTQIVSLIRIHAGSISYPAEAMKAINADLCSLRSEPPLTTMFLGSLNWPSNVLSYCRAGHPPAILVRDSSGVDLLHEGGPVLGAVRTVGFEQGTTILRPGDSLLGYSDGLSELRNEQGEEFGIHRLLDQVERCQRSSASHMLFRILGVAKDFAGSAQPEDDITVMALLRTDE